MLQAINIFKNFIQLLYLSVENVAGPQNRLPILLYTSNSFSFSKFPERK
jgi:hypothetical protein